ncbi:hypothetical protein [Chitinimonas sp.]|uniref:hypothetical protein n=1 Tax=Chitinimonas sp. TaxID=1934313 RepID=UPI002F947066
MTATRSTLPADQTLSAERLERIDTLTVELQHAITEYQAEKSQLQPPAEPEAPQADN